MHSKLNHHFLIIFQSGDFKLTFHIYRLSFLNFLLGKQPNGPGTAFEKYGPGQLMLDWGSFTLKSPLPTTYQDSLDLLTGTASRGLSMARTLGGEEADQVTKPGRRVLIGWTGPAPQETFNNGNGGSAQSLPRDLFVDPKTSKIVQQFVPDLQSLRSTRIPSAQISTTAKNIQ